MTYRVFRYKLEVTDVQQVSLPREHKILSVAPGRDGYYIDMWAKVPDEVEIEEPVTVFVVGTGHPLPYAPGSFIGTAVMSDGLVWHVWAR